LKNVEDELSAALRDIPDPPNREAIRARVVQQALNATLVPAPPVRRAFGFKEMIALAVSLAACGLVFWSLLPSGSSPGQEADPATIRALIESLGAPDVEERDRAEAELLRVGNAVRGPLEERRRATDDLEVRDRADRILRTLPYREILGPTVAAEFVRAQGGLDRVDVLLRHREELERLKLDSTSGLFLADAILERFPWRVHYDDGRHQGDLFSLRERICEKKFNSLSWVFARMLEHEHEYVRFHAVAAIRELGAREHLALILPNLDAKGEYLRREAALAVAELGGGKHRDRLVKMLDSKDEGARHSALEALGRGEGGGSLADLIRCLSDGQKRIRALAADLLDRHDLQEAVEPLRAALQAEKDDSVRQGMRSALHSLESLKGTRRTVDIPPPWMEANSRIDRREFHRIESDDAWIALWRRHAGTGAPPAVDFSKSMVIAVFRGESWNSRGVGVASVGEDDEKFRIRCGDRFYQTMGGADQVKPYGLFVLPRSAKPVILESNKQSLIGDMPIWEEDARLDRK
jgi:hypothetical protein